MKHLLAALFFTSIIQTITVKAQDWKPAELKLATRWSKEVSPTNALKEYPRPQMVRASWENLNGLWDYAIKDSLSSKPETFDGKILVPYPLESALSGVKKPLQPGQRLWYRKEFNNPGVTKNQKTLIHFGAVDYQCWAYINGKEVGTHEGGYTAFSFDITNSLRQGINEIVVKVYDPSDAGIGPRGKQVLNPQGIYYTPSSGIWQTVWIEKVPETYINNLSIISDIDKKQVSITVHANANKEVSITTAGKTIKGKSNQSVTIPLEQMKLWSPEDPYLYDVKINLGKDEVNSYFGMRKVEVKLAADGHERIYLNNQPYFNLGVLDQGFWPDGLHIAPTDEALKFDIEAIKAMGFNTIRKHIKVEPARWYYHADKTGMLVWQDFVQPNPTLPAGAKEIFEKQGAEMMAQLKNHPSITTWVLFNEKWGQYDQERLTKWIKQTDPTRLVNGHSGEILYVNEKLRSPSPNAWVESNITDIHSYPDPMNSPKQAGKAKVLGEFGGIGVFIPDHQWNTGSAWGYITVTPAAFKGKYTIMNQHLKLLEKEGLSASIYTQPFDVEGEQNGLMTYDREVVKIPFEELRKIHSLIIPSATNIPQVTAKNADLTEPVQVYASQVQEYLNGKKDPAFLKKLAMMAGQTNDAAGRTRFTADYVASVKKPYSAEDINFMEGSVKKISDASFGALIQHLQNDADNRSLHVKLMNIIYQDVIAAYVPTAQAKPDWDEIAEKTKLYGSPGEEIFLRAKTIHTLNQQDWVNFKPVAKRYLEKYGKYIKQEEKKMLEEKL